MVGYGGGGDVVVALVLFTTVKDRHVTGKA